MISQLYPTKSATSTYLKNWTSNSTTSKLYPLESAASTNSPGSAYATTTILPPPAPDNRLASLPPEIGDLDQLAELHLRGNNLTTLPAEIGNLANLRILNARDNHNLRTLPAEIGNLANLRTLNLMNDSKLAALPEEIGDGKTGVGEIGDLNNLGNLKLHANTCVPTALKTWSKYTALLSGQHDCADAVRAKPAEPTFTVGANLIEIGWTAPSAKTGTNGGVIVEYELDHGATGNLYTTSDITSFTISGLVQNYSYTARVRARNSAGWSEWSDTATFTYIIALKASDITYESATLTIANHVGTWYYKKTSPTTPAGRCTAVSTGTTVDLTGLDADTSYTYKAYSDSGCTNELVSETFSTPAAPTLEASDITHQSATLTIANHVGTWYYKKTSPTTPAGRCTAVSTGTTVALDRPRRETPHIHIRPIPTPDARTNWHLRHSPPCSSR